MANPVVHWELWSRDPARIAGFYERVFGWSIAAMPGMDYRMVEPGGPGGIGGGIMQPREGPWPGNMTFYVDVDDLRAFRERIVAAGGRILVEEMAVPGAGSFALFADPDERVIGLWKRGP
jgi:predicted enzyme related to lactoylglutathione lyase